MDYQTILLGVIGFLFGLVVILFCKVKVLADDNRMRTNLFHWMGNYRFKKIRELNNELKMQDEAELDAMIMQMGKKYGDEMTVKEILLLLQPFYDGVNQQFITKRLEEMKRPK